MSQRIHLDLELPGDLARFKLPTGVNERLEAQGRREAEGLVDQGCVMSLLDSVRN